MLGGAGLGPWAALRFGGVFAHVTGRLADGDTLPFCGFGWRISRRWGFAIYLASEIGYEDFHSAHR